MRRREREVVYRDETPMGARLTRFVVLLFAVSGIGGGAVIAARFSAETLALVVGLLIAGIPLLAIVALLGYVAVKASTRPRNEPQQMTIPPIIMQIPQAPQNALTDNGGYPWDIPQRQPATTRTWDVLGED